MDEALKLLMSFLGTFLALLAGYGIWHLKKRSEPRYQTGLYLNSKKMDALMKVWSLLAYITDTENPLSAVVWEKNGQEKSYYFVPCNGIEYIDKLAEIFYGSGSGLLLSDEVKDLLYEYRGIVYGFLLKEKDKSEKVQITNEKMTARMQQIYKDLNSALRVELDAIKNS